VKTFLEEAVSEILSSHSTIDELIIILPSRRAGVFFKDALTAQLTVPILSPRIFSIEEFIQEISTLKLAPSTAALIDFYEIYNANTPKDYLDSFEEFIRWAPSLLKDFSDLDAYLIEVDSAFEYLSSYHAIGTLLEDDATYEKQQFFWQSLANYFELHKTSLNSKGMGTLGMLYREAVDSVEIYLQNTNKTHYFIGFNALNTAESNLLQAFLEADRAEVLWDIDQYFFQDQQHAAGRFIQRHHKEWNYYRRKSKPKFQSHFEEPKEIKIIGIPKNIGQAKYAASLLKKTASDSDALVKTALVLGNESILIPILSGLPAEVDQWNVTMGYPLLNTPVASFFNHVFEMHLKASESGFSYQDVLRVLSFDWIRDVLQINSNKGSTFFTSLSNSNKAFLRTKELQPLLDHPVGVLMFTPFDTVHNFVNRIFTFTVAIQEYFKKENRSEYILFPTYFTLIQEIVQQLINMGDTLKSIDTIRGIHFLWNELIQSLSLDYKGNPMGGVQIMGMLETRVLDFDTIILTNVNEGILPMGRSSQSIFPFALKRKLGLPTFLDNDAIYTYHFYRLLQRAKNITLLYNTESEGLNSGEPSRFIHQLRFLGLAQHKLKEQFVSAPTQSPEPNKIEVYKTPEVLEILHSKALAGFSPSSLSVYLRDPLRFYKEKVLGVREENSLDSVLSLMDSGTIAHDTLEELYTPFLNKPLKVEDYKVMEQETAAMLLKHYRKVFGGDEKVTGKSLLMLHALEQSILRLFAVEKDQIQKGNVLTILKLEQLFEYPLMVEGVGQVLLKGKIDRIDRYNGVLRIIDYKSGKVDPAKLRISDWDVFKGDTKRLPLFQILLYSYVNKAILETEQTLVTGIISFKNMDAYVLPFGIKPDGKGKVISELNLEILSSFEEVLVGLIQEIFDISKPFASLEE
jgi:ATP-dependent helicase/nuclease subunit B